MKCPHDPPSVVFPMQLLSRARCASGSPWEILGGLVHTLPLVPRSFPHSLRHPMLCFLPLEVPSGLGLIPIPLDPTSTFSSYIVHHILNFWRYLELRLGKKDRLLCSWVAWHDPKSGTIFRAAALNCEYFKNGVCFQDHTMQPRNKEPCSHSLT